MSASPRKTPVPVEPANTAVDDFIAALRQRVAGLQRSTELPEELGASIRQVAAAADLPGRFTQAATEAGCQVHAATSADWTDVVRRVLRMHDTRSCFIEVTAEGSLPGPRASELTRALDADGIIVHTVPNDATLFAVDAAVTGSVAGIAETGTVVCESGAGRARGSSLIPPIHVVVVDVAHLVADLYDFFVALEQREIQPANVNLLSGPSKTADIEGILVTGVHGPGHVHIVLVGASGGLLTR